jgi:hypothetical protein
MATNENRFLVMGLSGLVQYDLIGAIKERFPGVDPITVTSEVEAIEATKQTTGWKFAFLNLGPEAFAASDLAALLATVKTKVILLGNAAEDAAGDSPFPVLMRPFTGADILRLLGCKG